MNTEESFGRVAGILSAMFGIDEASVTREMTADDVPSWDSITHVYVILEIERLLGLCLDTEAVFALENVGDLADLVARSSQAKPA